MNWNLEGKYTNVIGTKDKQEKPFKRENMNNDKRIK